MLFFYALREKCLYSEFLRSVFPAFGLNTERYGVPLRIQFKYRKIWTRKTYAVIFKIFDFLYLEYVVQSLDNHHPEKIRLQYLKHQQR